MKKEERSEIVMVRVTPRDKRAFEEEARKVDMSVSEFMRVSTLMFLVLTLKPVALKMVVKGAAAQIREAMEKLREPGLRECLWGVRRLK